MARWSGRVASTRSVDGGGLLLEQLRAPPGQLVEGDDAVAVGRTVEGDDRHQVGQVVAMGLELGDLRVVLGEDQAGARVGQDVGDVLRVGGRVDRRRRGPGAQDREVGQSPVDPRRGDDGDPLLGLDAERDQPGGERA